MVGARRADQEDSDLSGPCERSSGHGEGCRSAEVAGHSERNFCPEDREAVDRDLRPLREEAEGLVDRSTSRLPDSRPDAAFSELAQLRVPVSEASVLPARVAADARGHEVRGIVIITGIEMVQRKAIRRSTPDAPKPVPEVDREAGAPTDP